MKQIYNEMRNNKNSYENILAFEELINFLSAEEKEFLIH
jgi:hypothetical protein